MQALDPLGFYSNQAVIDALSMKSGSRTMQYRYDHLNAQNVYIEPLTSVYACTVANDALAVLKRTATISILDNTSINFLTDRIKPWAHLVMPASLGGPGFVEWPLGVFLLSSPERKLKKGIVTRDITAYDQLWLLQQNAIQNRYSIAAGVVYTTAIATLLASYTFAISITPSALTLPAGMEWAPGTTYLQILNDLLAAINYKSATFDENGQLTCTPYVLPSLRSSEFTYATGPESVMLSDEIDDDIDLFDVPNVFILIKSDADATPLVGTYTNSNPASPTSTVSRGITIADVQTEVDAADQPTITALAANAAFEASQVYQTESFNTPAMPMHSDSDILTLTVGNLAISGAKFSETAWEMPLKAGAEMTHSIRRVVAV